MKVDTGSLVSMTEANRNFSRVARLVDEQGAVVILRNNRPRYVVLEYDALKGDQVANDDELLEASRKLLSRHANAYRELAR